MSNKVANALKSTGVILGDKVALYCINSPWFVVAYYGILKVGATVVPINLLLNVNEIEYILSNSESKTLIYFDAFEQNVISMKDRLPHLKNLVVIGQTTDLGARPITDIIADENSAFAIAEVDQEEHVASIIYTSGTTGKPKGAMLTHRNLLHNVNSILQSIDLRDNDIFLTVLPMFHSFGSTVGMNTPIAGGATIIAVPQFMPDEVEKVIHETQATIFMGVPSMYTIFANIPGNRKPDFSSLRICFSGGAALPAEVMKRFETKYNVPICEGDGPTECSPATSINPIYGERKPGSIGKAIPEVQMKIVDQDGNEMSTDEIGEIVVRGENVMKGYFKMPKETAESFFEEWYRTGDMGYVDDEDYFYIIDRKKDMIIVNGMNVYPRMIEEVIYQHVAVLEVAVVPEPDDLHGEVPRAVIALKPQESASKNNILDLCRRNLGRHQIPRIVESVDQLPKSPTGKILKRELIRKGEIERGIDIRIN
ncbi:TPA: long-chain fatty acid--CoA ligase [Candidatus Poribacteria bacterium]|nr:long-chain fatty acid--CoA ligase [Candidatus Poribacteria bacterium]